MSLLARRPTWFRSCLALAAALAVAGVAPSIGQTTAPASRPVFGPGAFGGGGPRPPRDGFLRDGMPDNDGPRNGPRGPGGGFGREVTPEEWDQIDRFMQQHTPAWRDALKRAEAATAGSNGNVSRQLRSAVAMRYRELENMRSRNSPAYPVAVRRLEIEDQVLRTMRDLKAPNANVAELNKRLDDLMRQSVENSLLERGLRIEALRGALNQQSQALEADKKDVAGQAVKQRQRYERDFAPMVDMGNLPTSAPSAQP